MQGILNDRMLWFHLVRRFAVLLEALFSKWWAIVLGTPGMRRRRAVVLQGKDGKNSQPGSCLCKSGLQETVGYAGGKLPAVVANDWVTGRSPVPCKQI